MKTWEYNCQTLVNLWVKKKPEGHPLIIKLLLSLWLLYKNYINYCPPTLKEDRGCINICGRSKNNAHFKVVIEKEVSLKSRGRGGRKSLQTAPLALYTPLSAMLNRTGY